MKMDSLLSNSEPSGPNSHHEQYLFLMQFFIHHIESERLGRLNEMFYVPTTATLNFLHIQDDSIEITPVDPMFEPLAGIPGDKETFYSGRSILFAIPSRLVTTKSTELKIKLTVKKKMPDEVRPDILVGSGELDLSSEFAGLRKEMLQCWHREIPPGKTFEGPIEIFYENEPAGSALILVTISAYGQSIVTQMDIPPASATDFSFRSEERDQKALTYQFKIIDPNIDDMMYAEESKHDLLSSCPMCCPPLTSEHQLDREMLKSREKGLIQTTRGTPTPCGKPVVLKVSGLLDANGTKKPTVTLASAPSQPDPDIFVLRIGKKGLARDDEKSDLELEMRTPKGPERRPPIRYETREAQTELEPKETKKKGKGKGKK
uniref:Uncharacterized protein n=1 Tax=Bracon brevicornis TaxID=1563983 RepID=A0A6V7JTC4_9HYME